MRKISALALASCLTLGATAALAQTAPAPAPTTTATSATSTTTATSASATTTKSTHKTKHHAKKTMTHKVTGEISKLDCPGMTLTIKTTDRSGTLARSARASVIGAPHDSHIVGPGNHWLDLSAYTQPAAFTFGNSAPGVVRGPGAALFNLSLSKRFHVTEHKWFELRGEAFNLANTPVFNSPISQTITAATFGEISTTTAERSVQVVAKFYF